MIKNLLPPGTAWAVAGGFAECPAPYVPQPVLVKPVTGLRKTLGTLGKTLTPKRRSFGNY